MLNKSILFLLLLLGPCASGQDTLRNQILDEGLISVQCHVTGLPLSMPIVDLNAGMGILQLSFDHLGDQLMDYEYSFVHCNSDWLPSDLQESEYLNGFSEDRITNISVSFNTLQAYTHYQLNLPNANMRFTVSGNYVLKVWDASDEDRLVLTRRFMVAEPGNWDVKANFVRPTRVSRIDTHHEIDFIVKTKDARVSNPQNDVKAFILQNGRWDNCLGPIKPFIVRGDDLVFDYQDIIAFPAGKEFRFFDMRDFDVRGMGVQAIQNRSKYYEVTLRRTMTRADRAPEYQPDANGGFVIENLTANQSFLQCDYADVLFSLSHNEPIPDEDVYVLGALTDWHLVPEFKMKYDAEAKCYYTQAFLKQGYYNYQFVTLNRETGAIGTAFTEGDWHETGNLYTILVYFRPFGARFDRLVAVSSLDYSKRN
jgi:Domain of unknown function (DUF5103)